MDARDRRQGAPPNRLSGGPSAHGFFLDIDGTLLGFAAAPDRVRADPRLIATLRALHDAAGGALALISGRAVAGVDALVALLRLAVAGQHGAERRDAAGAMHRHPPDAAQLDALRRCIAGLATGFSGLLVEDKGMCLAVHYRQAPQLEAEVRRVLEECLARTGEAFRLQPGTLVLELKPADSDKGTAIREFAGEPPFAGRIPVFLGDDDTDEPGFAVVNRLGGIAVKVGSGASVAGYRIADVAGVRDWLAVVLGQAAP
ncbi:MAG: trehalose-phosphatase [Rhodocyclaceae bacterium]|nr:trehalose-phosphatase [Rhodocyclaceae bacterium]